MEHLSVLQPKHLENEIQPMSDSRLRVGVVSYLNSRPMVFGLKYLAPQLRIQTAPPAALARQMRRGRLDVALVPTFEYLCRPDYRLLRASAICADGRVRSVILFSRKPLEQICSVRLDPESLTSNALLQILCQCHFFKMPKWVRGLGNLEPSEVLERDLADAVLVIGNRALAMSGRYPYEYDLGREWYRMTRLPFVFAVWTVRPGVEVGDLPCVLRRSLHLGKMHLAWIARDAAEEFHLDEQLVFSYLKKMIRYNLTRRAWKGILAFFKLCRFMGLGPTTPPLDLILFGHAGDEDNEFSPQQLWSGICGGGRSHSLRPLL
ncbi:MAG: menaquinone biosynthesis protein [Candidatus Sumerlaeia bacterium]|nr:menaquinone biosynthesis protein [Candidatus Sumerlaeia bacterium]